MELVTLRQFAKEKRITYEAVRKQVIKYAEDLEGHIVTMDNTKYLDEYAQKFLSERRRLSPIVVKIEDTQADNGEYQAQIEALKTELLQAQKKVIQLQEEARAGLEDRIKYQMLLTDHEEQKNKLREAEAAIEEKRADLEQEKELRKDLQRQNEEQGKQIEELRREADSYERTFFGLYRKRKE